MTTGAALITGARRGIGRGIGLALAREGFHVALNDVESSCDLEAAVNEARALGVRAIGVVGDISKRADHARMLDEAESALGPLTTLINNAGVSVLSRGDLLDVTEESYDRCLDINTRGTFFLTQAFAKRLLTRPRTGFHHSIITVSSANATAVSIARGEYCISKAGVSMASKLFAHRLADEGVGVYEIQPGFIATEMTAPSKAKYDALIDGGLASMRRWGTPDDVARCAVTLAKGLLPYTVGQAIQVDGGVLTVRY